MFLIRPPRPVRVWAAFQPEKMPTMIYLLNGRPRTTATHDACIGRTLDAVLTRCRPARKRKPRLPRKQKKRQLKTSRLWKK